MALNFYVNNSIVLAAINLVVDALDAGAGAGTIQIRTGAQPATADDAITGTLLATLTFSDPAFGAAADTTPGGTATASAITQDSSADATGTAGYFVILDSNGVEVAMGSVGTSGADMNFNSLSITSGSAVSCSAFTVSQAEGP